MGRTAIRPSGSEVSACPCSEEGLVQQQECMQSLCQGWNSWAGQSWNLRSEVVWRLGWLEKPKVVSKLLGMSNRFRRLGSLQGLLQSYSSGSWCLSDLALPSQVQDLAFALVELHPPLVPFPKLAWDIPGGSSSRTLFVAFWRSAIWLLVRVELNWYKYNCE